MSSERHSPLNKPIASSRVSSSKLNSVKSLMVYPRFIAEVKFLSPTEPQNNQRTCVLLTCLRLLSQLRMKATFSAPLSLLLRIPKKRVNSSTTIKVSSSCFISSFRFLYKSSCSSFLPILKSTGPTETFSILSRTEAKPFDIPSANCFQMPLFLNT